MPHHDIIHEETYTDPETQRKFRVLLTPDYDSGPPQNECDGHGVIEELSFDPTDEESVRDHFGIDDDDTSPESLEKLIQHSMMLCLSSERRRAGGLYYDVWETLKLARADRWHSIDHNNDPQAHTKLHEAVMQDYRYIKGWYNDDWQYVTVEVTPYDTDPPVTSPDDDPEPALLEEYSKYLGHVEYGQYTTEEKAYLRETYADLAQQALHEMNETQGVTA
jgi:hypothetical protein